MTHYREREFSMETNLSAGGAFLFTPVGTGEIFTKEMLSEEQRMMAKTAVDFVKKDVLPYIHTIDSEAKKLDFNFRVLKKAGELGLLAIDLPEAYGGLNMGLTTSSYLYEESCHDGSLNSSWLAHSGIGTLPIMFFGNKAQREKYLTKLGSGELLGAYALTEAGSGSDAFALKTRATLTEDGQHYLLNGEKMFITNAGFADVFIVYAKVDGSKLTAFIVERNTPGLSFGPEEKKMGIEWSSTRPVILENVKVPLENVIGEIGKGHKSAMGILDIGRLKLGMGSAGDSKDILRIAIKYAQERNQFEQPIANFGMIRRKLAESAMQLYAMQSIGYRISHQLDEFLQKLDFSSESVYQEASQILEQYNIETAILKVRGSESQTDIANHAVQIFGGYGFIKEYPVERKLRDARISSIYEGTNEINRITVVLTILRRVMTGEMPLVEEFKKLLTALQTDAITKIPAAGPLGMELLTLDLAKKMTIYCLATIFQQYKAKLTDKAFIFSTGEYAIEPLANMIIDIYSMDSMLQRLVQAIALSGEEKNALAIAIVRGYVYTRQFDIQKQAQILLGSSAAGQVTAFAPFEKVLAQLTCSYPFDMATTYDFIAQRIIEQGEFPL
jgi:alkylation response protein AidB-like acyl-CoA dehydrogenase